MPRFLLQVAMPVIHRSLLIPGFLKLVCDFSLYFVSLGTTRRRPLTFSAFNSFNFSPWSSRGLSSFAWAPRIFRFRSSLSFAACWIFALTALRLVSVSSGAAF